MFKKTRDISDYIQDILISIKKVEEFTKGITFEKFSKDKKTLNAVIKSLEVLGEATKHILPAGSGLKLEPNIQSVVNHPNSRVQFAKLNPQRAGA